MSKDDIKVLDEALRMTTPLPGFTTRDPGEGLSPNFIFVGPDENTLATLNMRTGELAYGEGYTPDATARLFWEAMSGYVPKQTRELRTALKNLSDGVTEFCAAETNPYELLCDPNEEAVAVLEKYGEP